MTATGTSPFSEGRPPPPTRPQRGAELPTDVVTLGLGGEVLAIPATVLREVLEPVTITRVPGAPEVVSGLINVRGAVVPLADLRVTFGMPRRPRDADTRILVLELALDAGPLTVGILADSVHEVTTLDHAGLETMPSVGSRWPPRFVRAIGKRAGGFVMLPDLEAVFGSFLAGPSGPSPQPE